MQPRDHPRLALPFTVLAETDTVRLVAGEDFRYTLRGPALERWLPQMLALCDGKGSVDEIVERLEANQRDAARQLLARLYGERILVNGTARDAHRPLPCRLMAQGSGELAERLRDSPGECGSVVLHVLCQDRLDYEETRRFNRERRAGASPWLWASTAAMSRGYVSPVFVPDAGPCLGCLLGQFRMLSPAPELYAALAEHTRRGGVLEPVGFPPQGVAMLEQLVRWKASAAALVDPPAALFRLHVLEADTFEVSAHTVFRDPECLDCGEGR
jgi:bacteriocin biosynthesis cyclodehydratase domain-containing protein